MIISELSDFYLHKLATSGSYPFCILTSLHFFVRVLAHSKFKRAYNHGVSTPEE